MRFIDIATLVAVSWIVQLLSAAAQDSNSTDNFKQRFAAANVTHDGCLTRQQAVDGGLNGILSDFAAIDAARRGCVTLDQIRQFRVVSKFAQANTTHDGCLTRQQAIDGGMKQIVRYFDQIDTSHRGCITLEQAKKFTPQGGGEANRFAAANTTHDGCLTLDQAVGAHLKSIVQNFSAIDKSGRGCVTQDQLRTFYAEQPNLLHRPGTNKKGGIDR